MSITPEVLFEDSEILIVNKPFGMSSQDDLTETGSVLSYFSNTHPITRLDKRVGGLMVLAKNPASAKKYSEELWNNALYKTYHCVVGVRPKESEATLTHWLKKESKAKVFSNEVSGAKKATLTYRVLQSSERYHLLRVNILGGRFHQIRAQLAAIGSPIVGDLKYGFKRSSSDGSIFLCCTKIEWENHSVEIELPETWKKYGLG